MAKRLLGNVNGICVYARGNLVIVETADGSSLTIGQSNLDGGMIGSFGTMIPQLVTFRNRDCSNITDSDVTGFRIKYNGHDYE